MATNCLNQSHKGRIGYNASPVTNGSYTQCNLGIDAGSGFGGGCFNGNGRMPGSFVTGWPVDYSVTCHENQTHSNTDQSWNAVTQWADDTPIITSGPSAGSFTAAGSNVKATIIWATDSLSTSFADYGLTSLYGSTTGNGTLVQNHSVLLQNLTNHSTYHYRVRSAGGLGSETASGDNTFSISVPPTIPTLTAAADTTCASSCSATLAYSATDPDGGPIQYYVELSTDSSFATVNYNSDWISGTDWLTPSLATSTIWYWRVRARDAAHTEAVSAWSLVDSFYISIDGAPAIPTLFWPPIGYSGQVGYPPGTNFLLWNASSGATEYYLEYWGGISGNSGWTTATAFDPGDLPDNYTYWWRVKARNAIGESGWSDTWSWYDYWNSGSSCPFVYEWDGQKYEYITDLQGAPIGYSASSYLAKFPPYYRPQFVVLNNPKPDEQGKYNIKLRETLSEISYFDEVKLLAVDYPVGYELVSSAAEMTYRFNYANAFKLYSLKDPRQPVSAVDKNGTDVLASVMVTDGNLLPMDLFVLESYTFDFGPLDPANAKLVIDGWSVFGAPYATALEKVQPYIEVVDGTGQWVKVKSFGEPAGDMKRMVIDLSGMFLSNDHRIRLNTGRDSGIAWRIDKVMIDDSPPVELTTSEINAGYADLHYRGRASYVLSTLNNRMTADDDVLPDDPKAYGYGKFTKYGDVKALLNTADNIYAIMRHGDEIGLSFPGPSAPPADGMQRSFVLKTDVYYKVFRVDNNVEPLPFHEMSMYPYDKAVEHYPDDAEHQQYLSDYNTREYVP